MAQTLSAFQVSTSRARNAGASIFTGVKRRASDGITNGTHGIAFVPCSPVERYCRRISAISGRFTIADPNFIGVIARTATTRDLIRRVARDRGPRRKA